MRNQRLTFTFASTRRVDMTGFDMKEKDFRSGRQCQSEIKVKGSKVTRGHTVSVLQPPPKFFLNVCHYIYILFKKNQKVEFQKY